MAALSPERGKGKARHVVGLLAGIPPPPPRSGAAPRFPWGVRAQG